MVTPLLQPKLGEHIPLMMAAEFDYVGGKKLISQGSVSVY